MAARVQTEGDDAADDEDDGANYVVDPQSEPASRLERAVAVAAPLLAGVSFALIALILQRNSTELRLRGAALFLLVLAGVLLIASLQGVFWDAGQESSWGFWVRVFYDVGTLSLIAAVAVMLVPNGTGLPGWRVGAVVVAGCGFLGELVWTVVATVKDATLRWEKVRSVRKWLREVPGVEGGPALPAALDASRAKDSEKHELAWEKWEIQWRTKCSCGWYDPKARMTRKRGIKRGRAHLLSKSQEPH